MATHASALKRHRQSIKRRDKNRSQRSAIRTAIKETLRLSETGDEKAAAEKVKQAVSLLNKAATRGLVHKNNAARRISRLQRNLSSAKQVAVAAKA